MINVLSNVVAALKVACWCIGEYGKYLLDGISVDGETLTVSEEEVIELYHKILFACHISVATKQYGLMSLTKLSTRFPNATPKIQVIVHDAVIHDCKPMIIDYLVVFQEIIDAFGCHVQVDLQQRGVEYSQLFRRFDNMRAALLEPMPPIERDTSLMGGVGGGDDATSEVTVNGISGAAVASTNGGGSADILLLDSGGGGGGGGGLLDIISGGQTTQSQAPAAATSKDPNNLLDLLGDLDFSSGGGGPNNAVSPPAAGGGGGGSLLDGILASSNNASSSVPPPAAAVNNGGGLGDILGGLTATPPAAAAAAAPTAAAAISPSASAQPTVPVYNENGLVVSLSFNEAPSDGRATLTLRAVNNSPESVSDFLFQSAVPKSMQVELLPPSATVLDGSGGQVTQTVRVSNPNKEALRMRIRLSFCNAAGPVQFQDDLGNFPAVAW